METTESLISWVIRDRVFRWGSRTFVMGIVNVTPDSFSDGGDFFAASAAVAQAQRFQQLGADFIDIGGQSSRPDATEISPEAECDRVVPVIQAIRAAGIDTPISIDTTRSVVAREAIVAGADVINDVSGGLDDPQILAIAAQHQAPIILMHRRGNAKTMQQLTQYQDLIPDLIAFLEQQIQQAKSAGLPRNLIAIDPGIGFAKTAEQNLEILQRLPEFRQLRCPILIGTSRKSFIGKILDQPDPKQRIWGTAASCTAAIAGGADILRVHDVAEMIQVSRVSDAILRS